MPTKVASATCLHAVSEIVDVGTRGHGDEGTAGESAFSAPGTSPSELSAGNRADEIHYRRL